MKTYFFLLTALFYILDAKAQQKNIFKNKPWEDFRKKELLTQKLNQMNLGSNNNKSAQLAEEEQDDKSVLKVPLTATYEGNNGKGADIFAMQPYNMPCIVPDKTFKSNMPLAETGNSEKGFVSPFKRFQENKEKK
jgi:hypothetical protein